MNSTSNWQALTPEWLDIHHLAKLPERTQMIKDLEIHPHSLILDAGCGIGSFTSLLANSISSGMIIGIDLSLSHIAYAGKYLPEKQCKFVCADISNLPFGRIFDLVWCANTLQYFSNPTEVLSNFLRITKNGGRIVIKDEDVTRDILLAWEPEFELEIINAWYEITRTMNDRFWDPFMGRKLIGLFRSHKLKEIKVKTYLIERTLPVTDTLKEYITRAFWHYKEQYQLRLSSRAWGKFQAVFDPTSSDYLFTQEGFHFLSTETVVSGLVDI